MLRCRAALGEDDDTTSLLSVLLLSDGSVATAGEEAGVVRLDLSDGSVVLVPEVFPGGYRLVPTRPSGQTAVTCLRLL